MGPYNLTEAQIRLFSFFGVLAMIAAWEVFWPRRRPLLSRAARWPANLGIVVLNTVIVRILFPASAIGFAEYASSHQLGILNQLDLNPVFEIVVAVLVLDAAIYFQHAMSIGLTTLTDTTQMTRLPVAVSIPQVLEKSKETGIWNIAY